MRLRSLVLLLAVGLSAPLTLVTSTRDAHATDANVVYVDLDRIVSDVEEGKLAEATLLSEKNKRQPEISGREAKLKKMEDDLRRKLKLGDQSSVEQLGMQIQQQIAEYQQLTQQYQRELNEIEHRLYDPIEKRVKDLLRAVLVRDGYDAILSARGVAFGRRDLDVTQKVITEYNQKYPVAKGAAPAVTAPTSSPAPAASSSAK